MTAYKAGVFDLSDPKTVEKLLDSCLNTPNLERIYSFEKQLEEILLSASEVKLRHRAVRIDLLELVGTIVEKGLERRLQGDELFQVMRQVDSFLSDRNYLIKP
jgi:hypothetical protein